MGEGREKIKPLKRLVGLRYPFPPLRWGTSQCGASRRTLRAYKTICGVRLSAPYNIHFLIAQANPPSSLVGATWVAARWTSLGALPIATESPATANMLTSLN